MKGPVIRARPIGWVHNGFYEKPAEDWAEVVSEIEIRPELTECLDGLTEFSHIQVLFWMDRVSRYERYMKKFHPKDREDLPLLNVPLRSLEGLRREIDSPDVTTFRHGFRRSLCR